MLPDVLGASMQTIAINNEAYSDGRDIGGRAWSRVRFDIVHAPAGA